MSTNSQYAVKPNKRDLFNKKRMTYYSCCLNRYNIFYHKGRIDYQGVIVTSEMITSEYRVYFFDSRRVLVSRID